MIASVQQERRSRFVLFTRCKDKPAPETKKAIVKRLRKLSAPIRRTLTLGRGTENAQWETVGLPVYFCDPYSSWQKGSVENVIGLLRRYLPKGLDLATIREKQLKALQDKLNHRPRPCLGFKTPYEVLSLHCHHLVQMPAVSCASQVNKRYRNPLFRKWLRSASGRAIAQRTASNCTRCSNSRLNSGKEQ